MTQRIQKYTPTECGRRGLEIYHRVIRPTLTELDRGKYVVIDVDSEAYEIGPDERTIGDRLRERYPEAQICMVLAGYKAVAKLGGGPIP